MNRKVIHRQTSIHKLFYSVEETNAYFENTPFLNDFATSLNIIYKEVKMMPERNYDYVSPKQQKDENIFFSKAGLHQ